MPMISFYRGPRPAVIDENDESKLLFSIRLREISMQDKSTIEICNLRRTKIEHPWDFHIDRRTPVGNPYNMQNESERDSVCAQYAVWFHSVVHTEEFYNYISKLVSAYQKYGKLRLFCWCAPKRCHGETIKQHIESL